jgi:hypothetical protein
MTDKPVELDGRRGLAAQKATDLRRLLTAVEANEAVLRDQQEEVERRLLAEPARSWEQVAEKARYLLGRFAATAAGGDARTGTLIAAVLRDFDRLAASQDDPPPGFSFIIANGSPMTEGDCDAVARSLGRMMAGWTGSRLHTRLAGQHTISITVSGPLTVEQFQMVSQKVEQEATRVVSLKDDR